MTYVIINLSRPRECTPPRETPTVNNKLWMIIMCHYRFINSNKCPNLVGDVDNERGYASVGTKDIWEISVPSVQYCWEHSTPLKNKVYFLNM